jgi:adenylate cyclase
MTDQQTQNLTLMFVDIPTIGTIREQKGEGEARDCQQRCLALLGDVRKKYAGNLVRSIGGTLLCSFFDAGDAVDAAVGMQDAILESGLAASGVHIRMGLHCGPVHVRAGNYSGEVVTMAARMVTLAKPGCIVATGDVLEQAGERVERRFLALTGEAAERLHLDLYEVSW